MAGKVRYMIALLVVISLIYMQHSTVTYAGEKEQNRMLSQEKEEDIKKKIKDAMKEKELLEGEQDSNLTEGEEKPPVEGEEKPPVEGEEKPPVEGEEKPPVEGEEKPPVEGEEKPPVEGEEKPPVEGEEKPPVEGEEKPPVEGEDKPPVEEEKPPVEEKKPIEEYKIDIPKVNGKNGYYTQKPQIMICHVSEAGVTKYCLKQGDKKLEEKTLKEKGEKVLIGEKKFLEGKNVLHIWMEDEEGKKLEKYETRREFLIDTKAPEIQMSVPNGFDAWYQGQVFLAATGEDAGSGVAKISCREGERNLGSINRSQAEFVISQPSTQGKGIDVAIVAEDKAGNRSERIKTLFIDRTPPEIKTTGIKNYMITGKSVNFTYEIKEDNKLQEFYAQTLWENVNGKKKQLPSTGWKDNSTGKVFNQTLKNDGIYHMKVLAKDISGHVSEEKFQVIIDKTNPVIRYVETLNGQQLKKFKWDYPVNQMIQDFTTYVYEMRVDGKLYHMGEVIDSEGRHRMTVKATDAAGNKAQMTADFVVDHTAPEIIFRNIEGGEAYEEERTFKVELAGREDMFRQIQINGESQKIDSQKKVYEYTLHTCKDYEVTVKARDRAGNEAVKSIFFQVVPQKSLMEKIVEPVKVQWNMGKMANKEFSEEAVQGGQQKNRISVVFKAAGFGVLGSIMALFGMLYYRKIYKKTP